MSASIFQDPALLTAWATAGLFVAKLLVGSVTCVLIWIGIREIRRSRAQCERDLEEFRVADLLRHKAAMEESRRLHEEFRRQQKDAREESRRGYGQEESQRLHEEALDEGRRLDNDSRRWHEEAMGALKALIERTAPT